MYKVTINNAGQYSGFELTFRELYEAANFVTNLTNVLPGNAAIEYHIVPVKEEGEQNG